MNSAPLDVLCVMGTRPEIIKFAPVIHALKGYDDLQVNTLVTGQQADLIATFLRSQRIVAEHSLALMREGDTYDAFVRRAGAALIPLFTELRPRVVVVQGDTSTAFAAAVVAAFLAIPVIHIEAGLRSGDEHSPYPEEALRILITHCATLHCAPTPDNAENLRDEAVPAAAIFTTGNPIVDAVRGRAPYTLRSASLERLLEQTSDLRRVVLTFHRRENFGQRAHDYFGVIRGFIADNPDCVLVCPVHPNPNVRSSAADILGGHPRIRLIDPLDYDDFLALLANADLILSDSGGIQEETATLGVPLMILRTVTERPEILATGLATLAPDAAALARHLQNITDSGEWPSCRQIPLNPFGDGNSAQRIAALVREFLGTRQPSA